MLRVLTPRKVMDYLRRRPGHALARGDYEIEVIEGRRSELVTPEEPDGVRLDVPARSTLWGRLELRLYDNNPRAASDELAEEMVRMLVRVRRHLPRKV